MVNLQATPETQAAWLAKVSERRSPEEKALLQQALLLLNQASPAFEKRSRMMADILFQLNLDTDSLAVALLYSMAKADQRVLDRIAEQLGAGVAHLLKDTLALHTLGDLKSLKTSQHQHLENIRKMLIGMVTDIRTVLLLLTERLVLLRDIKNDSEAVRAEIANETLRVYAPLANRIGVWEIKWEMEDLCLRYLMPEKYKEISTWLVNKRHEREAYVASFIQALNALFSAHTIQDIDIYGRAKHIYSIYQKMNRKNMPLNEIYDYLALRVLVKDIDTCYEVLSVIQQAYPLLGDEFEDYIAQPKPNGYRSIHLVLQGPHQHLVEVQIRTHQMHQEAELGAASHWRYKEGINAPSTHEHKIALLRQMMAWQKEMSDNSQETAEMPDLFADRVYVFTPQGDIIDLPQGSTPIDFAYYIHSEVGHRCRGAKVNQKMVPLTTVLKTGQRVEILTAKTAQPSRDWMNPQLNYTVTQRARSSIAHWFRLQAGSAVLKDSVPGAPVRTRLRADIFTAIKNKAQRAAKQLIGIDHLLTKIGRCCKPLPGDAVMGYITRQEGISIHRLDCRNLKRLANEHQERLLEVNFGNVDESPAYPVDLLIIADDENAYLRDLTGVLASEKIQIIGLTSQRLADGEVEIKIVLLVNGVQVLNKIIHLIQSLKATRSVRRI